MRNVTALTDSIDWISRCEPNEDGTHMHLGQYLIDTGSGYVLVDAGAGHGSDLFETIQSLTNGAGIDVVVLTHSILPHTENVDAIRNLWADARVYSAVGNPSAVGLEDAEPTFAGQTETLAGETFTFLDPLITDVVVSTWIYHHDSKTLFTAEGVGHYHDSGRCAALSSDVDEIPVRHVHAFAADKLEFLEFVDPEKLEIGFENLLEAYEVDRLAPAHGMPIVGSDIDAYADVLVHVADQFEYTASRSS